MKDSEGRLVGERRPVYGNAIEMWANISPASGSAQTEQFGNLDSYDKVIVACDMNCPIDENTVLFIDSVPSYAVVTDYSYTPSDTVLGNDDVSEVTYRVPKYDYIVRRVAKSLNSISIAVRKVEVS